MVCVIRSFSLVYQVKKMSLIAGSGAIRCPDSVVTNATSSSAERTPTISVLIHHVMIHILILLPMGWNLTVESIHCLLVSGIALSQLGHEIAIEHSLAHLGLLLSLSKFLSLVDAKAAYTSLIEHLLLVHLLVDVGKHLMDS